jgi:predicted transcriptional regulator
MDDCQPSTLVKRAELLDALRAEPRTAGELERALSMSRSTVHRATEHLVERNVLRKEGQEFALTDPGRVAADEVVGFRDRMDGIEKLEPFLETADVSGVDLPFSALADAAVVRPDAKESHRVESVIRDRIASAESLRLFSGVVSPFYLEEIRDVVVTGATVEAVFDPKAVEVLFDEYAALSKDAAKAGEIAIKIHERCPFELFVFEETVGLAAHDDRGSPRLFVESSSEAVFDWADRLFERYATESEYATLF